MNSRSPQSVRELPSVSELMTHSEITFLIERHGRTLIVEWIRNLLDEFRGRILAGEATGDRSRFTSQLVEAMIERSMSEDRIRLNPVVNATGVILHTGLGRAPLAEAAARAVSEATRACNLEIDLDSGMRRHRGYQLDDAWKTLTGAEASLVVNNNAAATLLALQATCAGREVIISRGQLIEIGGSFRLPEIFTLSGAILREVGTTNQTHLKDYEDAITPQTAAILRVHPSNYRVIGFTNSPDIGSLATLAHERGLIAIDDIGSGCLRRIPEIEELADEPTFTESLAGGADLVLGSGDKLLGGPQCGILLGRQEVIRKIAKHHLARAVRIDKLTLAALSATLDIYLHGNELAEIPVLNFLTTSCETLKARAYAILGEMSATSQLSITVEQATTPVGGGSLPAIELPTAVLAVRPTSQSAESCARRLRMGEIRVMGRIQEDRVLLDLRSVAPDDDIKLIMALRQLTDEETPR